MEDRYKLSECEEMIMSILWAAEDDLDLMTVTARVKDEFDKNWKLQTVATFMTRLEKKKCISIYRVGRYSHYQLIVSLDEYRQRKLEDVLALLFDKKKDMIDFIRKM